MDEGMIMKNQFVTALLAGVIALGGLSGEVSAATWTCDLNTSGKYNWVPKWITFSDELVGGKVITIDNVTFSLGDKKTVAAKVLVNNDKRLSFKWRTGRARGRDNTGQSGSAVFDMRATFLRSKKKVVMFVNPRGYNNDESTRGPCVPSK